MKRTEQKRHKEKKINRNQGKKKRKKKLIE